MSQQDKRELVEEKLAELNATTPAKGSEWRDKLTEVNDLIGTLRDNRPPIVLSLHSFKQVLRIDDLKFNSKVSIFAIPSRQLGIVFSNCKFSDVISIGKSHLNLGLRFENCEFHKSIELSELNIETELVVTSAKEMVLENFDLSTVALQGNFYLKGMKVGNQFSWFKHLNNGSVKILKSKFNSIFANRFLQSHIRQFSVKDCAFEAGLVVLNNNIKGGIFRRNVVKGILHFEKVQTSDKTRIVIEGNSAKTLKINTTPCPRLYLLENKFDQILLTGIKIDRRLTIVNSKCFCKARPKSRDLVLDSCSIGALQMENVESEVFKINGGSSINIFRSIRSTFGTFELEGGSSISDDFVATKCSFHQFEASEVRFLRGMRIIDSKFIKAPKFFKAKLEHKNVSFHGSIFLDVSSDHAESSYRELKNLMNEVKNDVDEFTFSGLEINARRKKLRWVDAFEWFFSILYKAANNYGRNLWLPIVWLLIVFVLFTIFYFHNLNLVQFNPKMDSGSAVSQLLASAKSWNELELALYVSGLHSLGPLRYLTDYSLLLPATALAQIIFLIQAVLTTILWYLFIVGVRRRFKTL